MDEQRMATASLGDQRCQFESKFFEELCRLLGIKYLRTTVYHPASNGMVERLHCQLKAAIKCHNTSNWVAVLPIVLLGIRTAIKEDLNATAAELIYGTSIRLPAEFFLPATGQATTDFVNQIKERFNETQPQAIVRHGTRKVFIFRELAFTPYVFLRNDTVKGPLQPPYDGPYKVIERGDKHFEIRINDKNVIVSIDRLKPAFIINDDNEHNTDKPSTKASNKIIYPETRTQQSVISEAQREENAREWYVTRSRRHVRFPDRYQAS
jgi:hypothetical protein